MSWFLVSRMYNGEESRTYLLHNDVPIPESEHATRSDIGIVKSTGGGERILEANSGDSIKFRAGFMTGQYWFVNICLEFMPTTM